MLARAQLLRMLRELEIEFTHSRRHVSRNKFSGYRVYFRCGATARLRPMVGGGAAIGDVCNCRCNRAAVQHNAPGFDFGARRGIQCRSNNDGRSVTSVTLDVRSITVTRTSELCSPRMTVMRLGECASYDLPCNSGTNLPRVFPLASTNARNKFPPSPYGA